MTGRRRCDRPAVIAHRGASAEGPENSLEALDTGMMLGADAIELDVRRSAEGDLYVIHDATLDRTTDGSGTIGRLTRDRIAPVRLANGEGVPRLADVLERFPGVEITVDVKDPEAAADVVALIRVLDRVEETILYVEDGTDTTAFREYEGRRATSTSQALRLATDPGWLEATSPREIPEVVHSPMARDGVPIVTQPFVRRVRDSGRTVQVWTIDVPETALRLAAWCVDGIITNDVRTLRCLLDDDSRTTDT